MIKFLPICFDESQLQVPIPKQLMMGYNADTQDFDIFDSGIIKNVPD